MSRWNAIAAALVCTLSAACEDGAQGNSQTHWLTECTADTQCGSLSCVCGVCIAPCATDGTCTVVDRTTSCLAPMSPAVVALCGSTAPGALCLEPCAGTCVDGQQCVDGACIPHAPGGTGGHGGTAGTGGMGGSAGTGGTDPDAGGDAATQELDCTGASVLSFPTFDRSCTTAADCASRRRPLNCCGTELVSGVNHAGIAGFEAAAEQCWMQLPGCGCATGPTNADDGTMQGQDHPFAVVDCVDSVCTTSFASSGATTHCGTETCNAETQICVSRGPIGPSTQYTCEPVPAGCQVTRDCDCAAATYCTNGFDECHNAGDNAIDCVCPSCQ